MKDLLSVSDLTRTDIDLVLERASQMRSEPHHHRKTLRNETVVLWFAAPSTRTRIAAAAAVARLGATPVQVTAGELAATGPHDLAETAGVVSAYARAIVARMPTHADLRAVAAGSHVPVVNARSDLHHPLQAIADVLTLRDRFRRAEGLHIAFVGDASRAANSLVESAALFGVDLTIATPPGYEPDAAVLQLADERARRHGAVIRTTHDPYVAVAGANAVFTDAWLPSDVERWDEEGADLTDRALALAPYRVDDALMALADAEAVFLHCLPAHRGDEVARSVVEGERSLVTRQSENRLPVVQAVLHALVEGDLVGRPSASGAQESSTVSAGPS